MVQVSWVLGCKGSTELLKPVVSCPSPDLGNGQSSLLRASSPPQRPSPLWGPSYSRPRPVSRPQVPEALLLAARSLSPCCSAEGFLLAWQSTVGRTWGVLYFGYCIFQGYNLHLNLKKKKKTTMMFISLLKCITCLKRMCNCSSGSSPPEPPWRRCLSMVLSHPNSR